MKKIFFLIALLVAASGLKAQDLDIFQANLAWNYHANKFDAYNLGNGWQFQPELKYYFMGVSYGQTFVPNVESLSYQNEFLIGAYFRPTWGREWKRDSIQQYPLIIKGRPENANIQKFNLGLSFLYIPNPSIFISLNAGLSIKSLEIKNGVRDSIPTYPYYQGLPLRLEILYFEDAFLFFNRIKFSLETDNAFHSYRAITMGGGKYVDTSSVGKEKFFSAGLDFTVWAPQVGFCLVDLSLINRYFRYRGTDYFGMTSTKEGDWDYQAGLGIGLRRYEKLNNFLSTEILLGRYGLSFNLKANLAAFRYY